MKRHPFRPCSPLPSVLPLSPELWAKPGIQRSRAHVLSPVFPRSFRLCGSEQSNAGNPGISKPVEPPGFFARSPGAGLLRKMRDTLYFTLSDVGTAEQAVEELLLARVEIPQIRCLARPGMPLGELPEAGILQKADVMHGAGTGIAFGGVIGGIVGGLLVLFPPRGTSLEVSTMLIAAVAGAVFCVWTLSVARMVVSNSRISAFKRGIVQGNILLMVDVPFARTREISDLMHLRHPEALFGATAPAPAAPSLIHS